MMGGLAKPAGMPAPRAPSMPLVGAKQLTSPTPSTMSAPKMALPTVQERAPGLTLPSITSTQNEAAPIELGDPQRLNKIATLLRLGRK